MKKVLIFLASIFLFSKAFALDVSLNVNKTKVNINNPFQLTIQISSDKNGNIQIKDIKWLNNFKIIWQSQYQTYSSSLININWKIKQKITTNYNVVFTLLPKNKWDLTLWPAIISFNNKIYKTNKVQITVYGTKTPNIMLNNQSPTNLNNNLSIQNSVTNNTQSSWLISQSTSKSEIDLNKTNQNHNQQSRNNFILYFIFVLILLGIWILAYLVKLNKQNKILQKNNQSIKETTESTYTDLKNLSSESFLDKFSSKYWVENIHSKTFSEIVNEIKKKWKEILPEDLGKLQEILIEKFKS